MKPALAELGKIRIFLELNRPQIVEFFLAFYRARVFLVGLNLSCAKPLLGFSEALVVGYKRKKRAFAKEGSRPLI